MDRIDDSFRDLLDAQTFLFPCVGEVVSSNADKTVDVRPVFKYEDIEAPVIKSVPVVLLVGTGWTVDYSLAAGDNVLLIFGCHPIPHWVGDSKTQLELSRPELHHAVAVPLKVSNGVTIQNAGGTVSFEMSESGVKITGNLEVTGLVTAAALTPATQVSVSTHTHSGGTLVGGLTGVPTPGS